jgi:hypothetical protein
MYTLSPINIILKSIIAFNIFISFAGTANAASISQTKGTKALIQFEDTEMEQMVVGAQLYAFNSENKKIGILEIKQIKGTKAICEILKGRAENGNTLKLKGAIAKQNSMDNSPTGESEEKITTHVRKKKAAGFLIGMANNSFAMDVGLTNSTTRYPATLSGTSFNLKAFGDYDLSKSLTLRFAGGMETFAAKGSIASPVCDSGTSTACSVDFTYLAFEGSAHYNLLKKSTRVWVGIGYSLLLQASTKTNIQNLQTAGGTNQVVLFGAGADIPVGGRGFIPIVAEYGYFPGGSDVKATALYIRGGYGFSF